MIICIHESFVKHQDPFSPCLHKIENVTNLNCVKSLAVHSLCVCKRLGLGIINTATLKNYVERPLLLLSADWHT